jgi:LEA14-like dessication related protein
MALDSKTVLAGVGVIALGAVVVGGAAAAIIKNVIVTNGNPSIDNTAFSSGYLQTNVPVQIKNNNPFPIGIEYFHGVVTFGQVTLARVALPQGFTVGAGSTLIFDLDMDIPVERVANDISNLIAQGNIFNAILNKIELTGKLQVKGNFTNVPIPLNRIAIPIV